LKFGGPADRLEGQLARWSREEVNAMQWVLLAAAIVVAIVAIVTIVGAMLPKSHVVSRKARFSQPPGVIWDVIAGPPTWRPDLRSFEELPDRDGHRVWREVDKHGQKITFERVESRPPAAMVTRIADPKLPFGGSWSHELSAVDAGSVLKITEAGEVYNPIFRFVSRFIIGHSSSIEKYLTALGNKLGERITVEE
jgi:hypothetical protein